MYITKLHTHAHTRTHARLGVYPCIREHRPSTRGAGSRVLLLNSSRLHTYLVLTTGVVVVVVVVVVVLGGWEGAGVGGGRGGVEATKTDYNSCQYKTIRYMILCICAS